MNTARIAELLHPYVEDLSARQLDQISLHLDLLLRWNAKMNLTAVRDPEQIVTRHFGESFFLAREVASGEGEAFDIGSGAGFPGIPLQILRPSLKVTLVEAQHRKATFLREVIRAVAINAEVRAMRAEELAQTAAGTASLVTLRAVEKFEAILPIAASLMKPEGTLAILIGSEQAATARGLLTNWQFAPLLPIPGSHSRVLMRGNPTS